MCFRFSISSDDWKSFGPSFSTAAFESLMEFRNAKVAEFGPPKDKPDAEFKDYVFDPDFVPQGQGELFLRRAVAEIGFLLVGLATVVESVARIVLGLIAALPCLVVGCIMQSEDIALWGVLMVCVSTIGLLDTPLRSLVALVKNVCEERFDFDKLALCELANCR
jgi:hypothetical protein